MSQGTIMYFKSNFETSFLKPFQDNLRVAFIQNDRHTDSQRDSSVCMSVLSLLHSYVGDCLSICPTVCMYVCLVSITQLSVCLSVLFLSGSYICVAAFLSTKPCSCVVVSCGCQSCLPDSCVCVLYVCLSVLSLSRSCACFFFSVYPPRQAAASAYLLSDCFYNTNKRYFSPLSQS